MPRYFHLSPFYPAVIHARAGMVNIDDCIASDKGPRSQLEFHPSEEASDTDHTQINPMIAVYISTMVINKEYDRERKK